MTMEITEYATRSVPMHSDEWTATMERSLKIGRVEGPVQGVDHMLQSANDMAERMTGRI